MLRSRIGEHITATAAVLTVVSLALVFGASLRVEMAQSLPRAPSWVFSAIPHVNALLAIGALACIGLGVRAIRNDSVVRHRRYMLTALVAFGTFLVLYLYNVAINGPTPFPGPDMIRTYVYLPILVIHVALAVVCLPLLYYVALLGLTRPIEAIYRSAHARVARPAALLWAVSFTLGLVIYLQLHVIYA